MLDLVSVGLAVPATLLISAPLWPSPQLRNSAARLRSAITRLAGLQFLLAIALLASLAARGFEPIEMTVPGIERLAALSFYLDGVSSLMLVLVSFVGCTICRYSVRYLDGEHSQIRYFQWTGSTIGAVCLLVVSGNLLMFMACWIATSIGLHQLLLHYGHRPVARRAAWTKFTISRLGDAALIAACIIIYSEFQTLQFSSLFTKLELLSGTNSRIQWASWLLVVGAVTKSAQFPFHTWLPLTMETPTPVSALMHAGIVNAGGYLIIRTSPLVALSPVSMTALALVGAVTACFAAVVMLTQTSVKKSLAYSTIAQMGFMMLQCGLGAFSAAMLHILAHSLYKAHAFLSSGSVMTQRRATEGIKTDTAPLAWSIVAVTFCTIAAFLVMAFLVLGVNINEKPGGLLLGGILCLALTQWASRTMQARNIQLTLRSLSVAGALCLAYVGCFAAVDGMIAGSLPVAIPNAGAWLIAAVAGGGFVGMYVLHLAITRSTQPPWMQALYVHASNGFYVESVMRRVFGPLLNA